MSELLLIAAWIFPLALIPMLFTRLHGLLPLAALPALITAALLPPGSDLEIPWLLLGSQFGLDAPDRIFLMFSALIWVVAGAQAELTMRDRPGFRRFGLFFLLAMSGNFWLILGQDMANFYLGFTLMGLASYGLIIYNRDPAALRAGRVYLVMTLLAEVALLTAFMLIFMYTQDLAPTPGQIAGVSNWAIAFLLLGLGIKAGFLFVHMWLPMSYTEAPAPASAVLSGSMSKVALLGWIRYLPLGEVVLWDWGMLFVILGAMAIVYALVVGLMQTNPKAILAYSSISKMGLMGVLLGLAMMHPELSEYVVIAVIFFAAYHGLTKGALFLGVGISQEISSRWVFVILTLLAIVMAGAPLTSGAMHKTLIKPVIQGLDGYWSSLIPDLLIMATIGTTLMMLRFLFVIHSDQTSQSSSPSRIAYPWLLLIAVIVFLPFLLSYKFPPVFDSWPILAGVFIASALLYFRPRFILALPGRIPPGDIIRLFSHLYRLTHDFLVICFNRLVGFLEGRKHVNTNPVRNWMSGMIQGVERSLAAWQISGVLFMVIGIGIYVTLWLIK
jgi:formate hydrogenlyase subunit 3/multisubunit Na+/H+ antiporter MnhD subunit